MKNWYSSLRERYESLPEDHQILNMVSDLKKAKNFYRLNPQVARNHLVRALILLDYIVDDQKWRHKLKEILRLREAIASLIDGKNPLGDIDQVIFVALTMEPKAYRLLRCHTDSTQNKEDRR